MRLGDFDAVRLQTAVLLVDGMADQREDDALGGLGRLGATTKTQIARLRDLINTAVCLLQYAGQAQCLLVELARCLLIWRGQKRDELGNQWACHGINYAL